MTARTTPGDGDTSAYTYAGTDQVELISQTGGRSYAYGRTKGAGPPIVESYRSSQGMVSYTYGPQDTRWPSRAPTAHYLALDGMGSPVALVNHSGGQTAAYSHDPYSGATASAVGGSSAISIQIYGYVGGITDATSTMVHFGQRWYARPRAASPNGTASRFSPTPPAPTATNTPPATRSITSTRRAGLSRTCP